MTYLIDSDVLIDYLHADEQAVVHLSQLAPAGLHLSIVTIGEVYDGIYSGFAGQDEELRFLEFLGNVDIAGADLPVAQQWARLRVGLRRRGEIVPDADLLIAATAIRHNLTLVTRNLAHFSRIDELRLRPI